MGNGLSMIRVEGNLGARKTRGNLPLPLFGDDLRHRPKGNNEHLTITSGSTVQHEERMGNDNFKRPDKVMGSSTGGPAKRRKDSLSESYREQQQTRAYVVIGPTIF